MNPKQIAAERSVTYVHDGMTVGLGSGSTAAYAVGALARRLRSEGLEIRCVATSSSTHRLAKDYGLRLVEWDTVRQFDVTIDGADEIDPQFRMTKGGGGALVREKIVAALTVHEIIIVDPRKVVDTLGAFPLPLAVIPFGWEALRDRLSEKYARKVTPRLAKDGSLYATDEGLLILDIDFGAPIPDPDLLEPELKSIPGVAEVGLFRGLCHRLIVGHPDGRIEERLNPALP